MTTASKTLHPVSPTPSACQTKPTTRPSQLRKLLARNTGATIVQIQTAFDWQPHTARAAISRLRKAGEIVDRKEIAKGSVYRIATVGVAL